MKNKIIVCGLIGSAFVTAVSVSGCRKDDPAPASLNAVSTAESRMAHSNAIAQSSFEDATGIADEAIFQTSASGTSNRISGSEAIQTSCATVSLDLISVPHVLTIDYGTTDCLGHDGNYRKGIVTVTWTGHYFDPGAFRTVTFEDYYLNFNRINGTVTISNTGLNAAGNRTFSIAVNGTVNLSALYSPSGNAETLSYSANWTKERILGAGTFWLRDDVYLIRGTSSGTSTLPSSFSVATDANAPLRKETGFPHFTSGILNISSDSSAFSVDYSYLNNARDNLAMVTSGGQSFVITLGKP